MSFLRTSTRVLVAGLRIPACALLVSSCAVAKTAGDDSLQSKSGAYFVDLKTGATVHSPVQVKVAVKGTLAGHFDILIDKGPVAKGTTIPKDSKHIHLGKGETEVKLPLELGKHELTVQFADESEDSYGPSMSQSIAITVVGGSSGDGDTTGGDGDTTGGDGDTTGGDGDTTGGDGDTTGGDGDTTGGDGDTTSMDGGTGGDGDTTGGDGDTTGGDGDAGSTGGGNCSGVPTFTKGTTYKANDKVQVSGHLYQCKSGAESGWCSLGTYEPGTGTNWMMAWNDLGGC